MFSSRQMLSLKAARGCMHIQNSGQFSAINSKPERLANDDNTKISSNRTPPMHMRVMHHSLTCLFSLIAVCSTLQTMSDIAYYSTPATHVPPTVTTRQWTRASRAIHIHVDIHPAFLDLQLRIAILASRHAGVVVSGRRLVREDRGLGRRRSYVPERMECGFLGLRDCDRGLCGRLRV